MLASGDWVTARLDGVPYLEKPPLIYWTIALSYKIFGVHDWAARIPIALSALALCWLTAAFGVWAFGKRAGFYAGLCMATCVGLFLFTRILIPDVMLTFTIALAMWAFLRALDEEEPHPRFWAFSIRRQSGRRPAAEKPDRRRFSRRRRDRLSSAYAPAFFLENLEAPPSLQRRARHSSDRRSLAHPGHAAQSAVFCFHPAQRPGPYHGFLWFFFINEQLLRFLNLRYPRDYNTVPRLYFWLFHLVWLFPWSVYLPAVANFPSSRSTAPAARACSLCAGSASSWFSSRSPPRRNITRCRAIRRSPCCSAPPWPRRMFGCAGALARSPSLPPAPLSLPSPFTGMCATCPLPAIFPPRCPASQAYSLSLGHMQDLTLASFAYLRVPLLLAAIAFLIGALGNLRAQGQRAFLASALMMVLFFHAARMAMVVFDPYLSSRPLAEALLNSPDGDSDRRRHYYPISSVFFYTNRTALLLNGRVQNLEYGSNAPGAADVFIDDAKFATLWTTQPRFYLVCAQTSLPVSSLVGAANLDIVAASGGKLLLTNHPLSLAAPDLTFAALASQAGPLGLR